MTEVRVYPRHAAALGMCVSGQRRWARSVGMDFRAFARHGMPASDFARIEHPMVPRIITVAEQEAAHGREEQGA